jgi:hypothetical protein
MEHDALQKEQKIKRNMPKEKIKWVVLR